MIFFFICAGLDAEKNVFDLKSRVILTQYIEMYAAHFSLKMLMIMLWFNVEHKSLIHRNMRKMVNKMVFKFLAKWKV